MSLQLAAKHIQKHGRNGDSMLVHMSPKEVKSLNDLAMAHGGHLTINPHTGLPEAGFLSSILPMVAGVGLMAVSGGAINPMTAGLLTGGATTLATGSLTEGLMAGMGAYGGAGLGESLVLGGAAPVAAGAAETGLSTALQAEQAMQANAAQALQTQAANTAAQNAAIQNTANVVPQATNAATLRGALDASAGFQPVASSPITELANTTVPPGSGPSIETLARQVPNAQSGLNVTSTANAPTSFMDKLKLMGENFSPTSVIDFAKKNPLQAASGVASMLGSDEEKRQEEKPDTNMGQRYAYSPGYTSATPSATGQEQAHFNPSYRPIDNTEAKKIYGFADGGATTAASPASYTAAEPTMPITMPAPAFSIPTVNSMADLVRAPESQGLVNAYLNRPAPVDVQGQYNNYLQNTLQSTPMAVANSGYKPAAPVTPTTASSDARYIYDANARKFIDNPKYVDPDAEKDKKKDKSNSTPSRGPGRGMASSRASGYASGGLSDAHFNLGGYSDGGRLLRGPGDGVSDSIPAVIGKKQPARLADGEFVVPARIVSELGNGSTEAGARKLYAMMDRIQSARGKTVGKGKVAKNSRSEKYLPA